MLRRCIRRCSSVHISLHPAAPNRHNEFIGSASTHADVRKAEELELADDLLDRHLGALSPGAHDLRDAGLNPNIS
jgi:hypothetical protein